MNKIESTLRAHYCVARFDEATAVKLLVRAIGDVADPLKRVAKRTEIDDAILELSSSIRHLGRVIRSLPDTHGAAHVLLELLRAQGKEAAPLEALAACFTPELATTTAAISAKNLRAVSLHRRRGPAALTWRQGSDDYPLDPDALKAMFDTVRKQYGVQPRGKPGSPTPGIKRLSDAKAWAVVAELLFQLLDLDISPQRLQRTIPVTTVE